jgi:protein-S-isoprenylcysteine O-methyltransferase Ste14
MDAGAKFVMLAPIPPLLAVVVVFWHLPWTPMRIAGLIMLLVSLGLLTLARVQLGNSFSVTPQAKQLVRHGIYSKVRHPVYVFGLLLLCGFALYVNMPLLLLGLVVLLPVQVVRARAEEKVLEEKFGAEYAEYRKTTWI